MLTLQLPFLKSRVWSGQGKSQWPPKPEDSVTTPPRQYRNKNVDWLIDWSITYAVFINFSFISPWPVHLLRYSWLSLTCTPHNSISRQLAANPLFPWLKTNDPCCIAFCQICKKCCSKTGVRTDIALNDSQCRFEHSYRASYNLVTTRVIDPGVVSLNPSSVIHSFQ